MCASLTAFILECTLNDYFYTMAKHNISLLIAIVLALLFFINTMVFTALAALGIHPFLESTSNISDKFITEITPAGWTFTIWSIIYVFLALVLVYVLSGIFRKNAYGYVYCSPPILPRAFFAAWCLNLATNTAWLFLWDRKLMHVALVFLVLIALTNYAMIIFSCHGLHSYGAWLNKYHRVDLWLHRVLVQNGVAIYATWTTIASIINLTIVLTYDAKMYPSRAATTALAVLAVVLFLWFMLETFVFDKHVRYIITIYLVVIWALTGVFMKKQNALISFFNSDFIDGLLAVACILFGGRMCLVIWRHIKYPFYEDVNPDTMSPMEVAEKQRKIFM